MLRGIVPGISADSDILSDNVVILQTPHRTMIGYEVSLVPRRSPRQDAPYTSKAAWGNKGQA